MLAQINNYESFYSSQSYHSSHSIKQHVPPPPHPATTKKFNSGTNTRYMIDRHALLPGYTNDYTMAMNDGSSSSAAITENFRRKRELNPNELQKTMQIIERIRSKYISDVHPASIGNEEQLFESVFKQHIRIKDQSK
eukprot:scaffold219356_cov42-Cyclotella_meneghiniana.AAC.3